MLSLVKKSMHLIVFILIIFLLPLNSFAQERQKVESNLNKNTMAILITEGTCIGVSGLYTASPKIAGVMALAVSPLAIAAGWNRDSIPASLTLTVGYVGIAAYNIIVPARKGLSKRTIFARNLIGWNGLILVGMVVDALTPNARKQVTAWNMDLALKDGYPILVANYYF